MNSRPAFALSGHLQADTFSNNLKDAQTLAGYMAGGSIAKLGLWRCISFTVNALK